MQRHAALCVEAAEELLALLPAAGNGDWDTVAKHYERIIELENSADVQKHEIRSNLPRGFFLPVARADLLDLLGRQDNIANGARDVAGIMTGRHMQFPVEIQPRLFEYAESSIAACRGIRSVIGELDELIVAGFRGPEARRVAKMIETVEAHEHRTDEIKIQVRMALFAIEDQLPPVQVVFFYQAIDLIGYLADVAERVGHRVQMMLAK